MAGRPAASGFGGVGGGRAVVGGGRAVVFPVAECGAAAGGETDIDADKDAGAQQAPALPRLLIDHLVRAVCVFVRGGEGERESGRERERKRREGEREKERERARDRENERERGNGV